jgi:hypothetical protein
MKEYGSRDDFLADLRALIEQWCDERRLRELSTLLPGYLAMNGLTDGWAALGEALKATRAAGFDALGQSNWDRLNDLIHATERAVNRR